VLDKNKNNARIENKYKKEEVFTQPLCAESEISIRCFSNTGTPAGENIFSAGSSPQKTKIY
jgi:hypothetical protein